MKKLVLITGGAGFIGAHVAKELLTHGYGVRALDNLVPQVHGAERARPDYLSTDVELMVGDVRDPEAVFCALQGVDFVVHLASLVGVGQSMYQISEYTSVNNLGTATLLQALSKHPPERLVVASSMSIYGEGLYVDATGSPREPRERQVSQLKLGQWEPTSAEGETLRPAPTGETKKPNLASVYALSKFDQERMCLIVGKAYGFPVVALLLFNTYGPFQALSNPYTGVLSNFASRALNGKPPLIFEDGRQKRDFVSVYDVAAAFRLALATPEAAGRALNISSGEAMTVADAASRTIEALGATGIEPQITGNYRSGDIRHCFADIGLAESLLGWRPRVTLQQGLRDLAKWLTGQKPLDRGMEARSELAARGLML